MGIIDELSSGLSQQELLLSKLNRDPSRPIDALKDGYYEASVTYSGSIVEALLKVIWQIEEISGNPEKKTIEQLFSVIKNRVKINRRVSDYIRDIQRARNRASHECDVSQDDAVEVLRKLIFILDWFSESEFYSKFMNDRASDNRNGTTKSDSIRGRASETTSKIAIKAKKTHPSVSAFAITVFSIFILVFVVLFIKDTFFTTVGSLQEKECWVYYKTPDFSWIHYGTKLHLTEERGADMVGEVLRITPLADVVETKKIDVDLTDIAVAQILVDPQYDSIIEEKYTIVPDFQNPPTSLVYLGQNADPDYYSKYVSFDDPGSYQTFVSDAFDYEDWQTSSLLGNSIKHVVFDYRLKLDRATKKKLCNLLFNK